MAVLWVFASSDSLGLYNVIPLFLVKEKGMDLEMANAIFGFSRIGGFFVTLLAGFFADRFGAKRLLLLLLLTTGVNDQCCCFPGLPLVRDGALRAGDLFSRVLSRCTRGDLEAYILR